MTAGILVVGELCADIVVGGVPTQGRRLRFGQSEDLVERTRVTLGSSGGITACAAAQQGARVALLAVVGDDELGSSCRRWLRDRGVDDSRVRVDPEAHTGSSVILVRRDDPTDRQILTDLGAISMLGADDLRDDQLDGVAHVHVSSFFLHTRARTSLHLRMARARELGAVVSVDPNDDPAHEWGSDAREAVRAADVLFCNDDEARGLAGLAPDADPVLAARSLHATMPRRDDGGDQYPAVVLKLGAGGAMVITPAGDHHASAAEVTVVDTVGAGDTLAGTALAALARGDGWARALALAVAAASLSTTGAGGVAAQAGPELVDDISRTLTTRTTPPQPRRRQ